MEHRVPDSKSLLKKQNTREIEIDVLLTGHGGGTCHALRGHMGRPRQSEDKERGRTSAHAFIRVRGWGVLGFPG